MTGHPEAEPTFPGGHTPECLEMQDEYRYEAREAGCYIGPFGDCDCERDAEAWAWRCSDQMPNSAQSHLDSMADGDCLLYGTQHQFLHVAVGDAVRAQQAMALGLINESYSWAARSAHAAFQACPGLKL